MQSSNTPDKLVLPFAASGAKNTIPAASQIGITAGKASLTDGFPPLTRTPLSAGGVPPSGLDMNGILYEMSAVIRWANAGGGYPFDAVFASDANVGGYPKGARIMRSDGLGYWFNTAENQTVDPESAGAAAAGWVPDYTYGVAAVAIASANVTLTPSQYGKPIIVISGTLTANINLIFPNISGEWTVVNGASGAFSVTCKTASGTGIALPTGYARRVYGDGTNIGASDNIADLIAIDLANQISASKGSALVGYFSGEFGSAGRTVHDKLRDFVSALDFGADPSGVTSSNVAIQNALNTGKVVILPQGTYKMSAGVILQPGGGIIGFGEKSKLIRAFTGGRLVGFQGGTALGDPIILRDFVIDTNISTTPVNGDTGIELGYSTGWVGRGDVSNIIILNQWDGFKWTGGSMNPFRNIQCLNNYGNGFVAMNGRGELYGCLAQYNAGHGYFYYMATQAETGIQFTRCGTFANKGWGYLFDAAVGIIGANIFMSGVGSSTDGAGGIGFAKEYRQIWLNQILIESSGDAYIPYNANALRQGETPWSAQPLASGLYCINDCKSITISDIFVQTCLANGVHFDGINGCQITNITSIENGRSQQGGAYQNGLYFNSNNSSVAITNIKTTSLGGNAYQLKDINIAQANNSISFVNSKFATYTSAGGDIRHMAADTAATTSVASAAIITLPEYSDFITITGTTNINAMTASYSGRRVTLKFSGILTVYDGNNFRLSTNFTTSADDTLTLACDGTNWYEIGRSIN